MIKKIRVKNFKSFKDMELNLGKVNILIGANGSGKSNFVRIFEFLKDIAKDGLDKAISKDGYKYIKNINSNELSIDITFDQPPDMQDEKETKYSIFIKFKKDEAGIENIEDKIIRNYKVFDSNTNDILDSGIMLLSNNNSEPNIQYISSIYEETPQKTLDTFKSYIYQNLIDTMKIKKEKSLLESPYSNMFFDAYEKPFSEISIYDLDPQLSKKAIPIDWSSELAKNGENLVNVVLMEILQNPEKKRMFLNLVTYLLPYIEDIEVDKFTETHFYLRMKETYSEKHYLPAPLISDGTINALGLIVALYFQESPLIIIEEPDRGFHPSLISSVVEMMKDAAKYGNKQIIVTTHNPIMIKHADPEDVFLVSRDKEGFSQIHKPIDKDEVKIFLENEMRLVDLYETNLLEI
ncbi:TPA: ATPase [bacterium]|nr:ATPase [bacterium]